MFVFLYISDLFFTSWCCLCSFQNTHYLIVFSAKGHRRVVKVVDLYHNPNTTSVSLRPLFPPLVLRFPKPTIDLWSGGFSLVSPVLKLSCPGWRSSPNKSGNHETYVRSQVLDYRIYGLSLWCPYGGENYIRINYVFSSCHQAPVCTISGIVDENK